MNKILTTLTVAMALTTTPTLADKITLIDASDYAWKTTPEGVAFAPLQGDRFHEPYQAMVKLPAGLTSPAHVKSANMFGIMLQGDMIHYTNGTDPELAQVIGAGSFYKIPRNLAHISACVSTVPCIAYLYQDGAFDFAPVTP